MSSTTISRSDRRTKGPAATAAGPFPMLAVGRASTRRRAAASDISPHTGWSARRNLAIALHAVVPTSARRHHRHSVESRSCKATSRSALAVPITHQCGRMTQRREHLRQQGIQLRLDDSATPLLEADLGFNPGLPRSTPQGGPLRVRAALPALASRVIAAATKPIGRLSSGDGPRHQNGSRICRL